MQTVETTATEVWFHAADHGDKPVIHDGEIDYDDVHDGVHYHAQAREARQRDRFHALGESSLYYLFGYMNSAANRSPEVAQVIEEALTSAEGFEAESEARRNTLRAKRDQDAAMATYEVSA